MLSAFVVRHREEIIARCRGRVATRMSPETAEADIAHGIPLFLDQLSRALRGPAGESNDVGPDASRHGRSLMRRGFTVGQVIYDYGDVCQVITELAMEHREQISASDFQTMNKALDDAIAGAVTEYERERESHLLAERDQRATEDLGYRAHELRNLIATSTLAFEALQSGGVGVAGSTGAVLARSLGRLSQVVDRLLAEVRLSSGVLDTQECTSMVSVLEEVEVAAMLEARSRRRTLHFDTPDRSAFVSGDRHVLASILANLLQNALKYTKSDGRVVLRTRVTDVAVRFEIEDECGGLPEGFAESLFLPFAQRAADRSGLGLGLALCMRGARALGATIHVRDIPGKGCEFSLEMRRATEPSDAARPHVGSDS